MLYQGKYDTGGGFQMRKNMGLTGMVFVTALAICWIPAIPGQTLGPDGGNKPRRSPVGFNRDIRPILSNTCFVCHGPDNKLRKAKLRLDQQKHVLKKRDGYRIIVPGK